MDFLTELASLKPSQILALTVIGSLVTAAATLTGIVIKDYFFARSFESWKHSRELNRVYSRYRDPLVLTATELLHRLREILFQSPVNFLQASLLKQNPSALQRNDARDPYYRKYKLVSTVYRFTSLLGWLELYRRELTFLDSGRSRKNQELEEAIRKLRSDFADGHLNAAKDWETWKDQLVFREELRAIGETVTAEGQVVGYARFARMIESDDVTVNRWLSVATYFFLDLNPAIERKDFRTVRCLRAIWHLLDLISVLDSQRLPRDAARWRDETAAQHARFAVAEPL